MKKENNSNGKKFQGRQSGEKRLRKNTKAVSEIKEKPKYKKSSERPSGKGFGKNADKEESGKRFGKKTEYGAKSYGKKDGFSRSGDGERKYGRKKYGSEESGKFGENSERKPRGAKPSFRGKTGSDNYGRGENGDRKTRGTKPGYRGKAGGENFEKGEKREYSKAGAVRKSLGKAKRNASDANEKLQDFKSKKRSSTVFKKGKEKYSDDKNYKGSRREKNKNAASLDKGTTLLTGEARLNRYIANSGVCSRREADDLILQGLVTINGKVVEELGTKVQPGDDVRVDGKRISPEKPIYILLNKPKGYITTVEDPQGRKTVMELIDLPGKERIFPVGRLDRNTSGVLLLTNDGELSQKLTHPSFEIKKVYKAKLDRKPSREHMLAWVNGVELEDGWMSFEQVGFVDPEDESVLGLEISSGRNRIVRRMFEFFEYEVESLDRVLLGEFDKVKLGRGKWRFLTDKEVNYIEKLKRMKPKRK